MPSGPASGPQTQMAQNLVLSWLAGGRIMELKTVQVNDELKISRPCIDAANVGYNVEWSQELRVADSLDQYVQGAMLIHMLRHAPEVFGNPFGDVSMAGIERRADLRHVDRLRPGRHSNAEGRRFHSRHDRRHAKASSGCATRFRAGSGRCATSIIPTALSRSITLSTFHGCPADEIERICEFLLTELDVHVIVKMNPPMLGKERLEHLLYDVMGYTDLRVNEKAYTSGLQFDESLEICGRLSQAGRVARPAVRREVLQHARSGKPSRLLPADAKRSCICPARRCT